MQSCPSPDSAEYADQLHVIQQYAHENGFEVKDLIIRLMGALSEHLKENGCLTFPLTVQLPSPRCYKCPLHSSASRHLHPANIHGTS